MRTITKIPIYSATALLNGKFAVQKYDMVKDASIKLKGEIFLTMEEAQERARELNKDIEPFTIQT